MAGFLHVSAQREGTAIFGMAFGTVAEQLLARRCVGHVTLPAVVVFNVYKGELVAREARTYSGNMSDVDALEQFLVGASLPMLLVELTPSVLPALRARMLPIVLLFAESGSCPAVSVMEEVAQWPSFNGAFSFAYMLRHSYGAQTILSEYWPQSPILPALVVVDFNQGTVHRWTKGEAAAGSFCKEALVSWLSAVQAGTAATGPGSRLGAKRWPPAHLGYDFLALAERGPALFQHDRLTRPQHHQGQQQQQQVADAATVDAAAAAGRPGGGSGATQPAAAAVTVALGSQLPAPAALQRTEL